MVNQKLIVLTVSNLKDSNAIIDIIQNDAQKNSMVLNDDFSQIGVAVFK